MAVAGLNHFNICAPPELMRRVRDFYVDVIGLTEGYRPDFGIGGHWLYAGDSPVLHLMERGGDASQERGTASYLDHVALTCTGLEEVQKRLERLQLKYERREFPAFGFAQLVLVDPAGLGVELNFNL